MSRYFIKDRKIIFFFKFMWVQTIIDINVHQSLQIKNIKLELIRYYVIDYNLQQTYFNDNSDSSANPPQ